LATSAILADAPLSFGAAPLAEPSDGGPTHELRAEYRSTEVFDESPVLVPPPDKVAFLSDRIALSGSRFLTIEGELFSYGDSAQQTGGLVRFQQDVAPGMRLGAGLGYFGQEISGYQPGVTNPGRYEGWVAFAEIATRLGPNLDASALVQVSRTDDATTGGRYEARLLAALSPRTSLRVRGWIYSNDDADMDSTSAELGFAQCLGETTALHGSVRRYESTTAGAGQDSTVTSLEIRQQLYEGSTGRFAYRWYEGSDGVTAEGPCVGLEQAFRDGSFSLFYRHYSTSGSPGGDLAAGTWWFVLRYGW
jgi:hypothetical protein